jgi:hypothetical protein
MAISKVQRVYSSDDDGQQLRQDRADTVEKTQRWEYWVETSTIQEIDNTIRNASAGSTTIPAIGATHPTDTTLVCIGKSVRRDAKQPRVFYVSLDWGAPTKPETAATEWNVELSVSGIEYRQKAEFDSDNAPIVNSAGAPFEPGVEKSYYDEQLTISFNSTTVPAALLRAARGKVNSDSVSITVLGQTFAYDARQLKCTVADYQSVYESGTAYWRVNFVFLARDDYWTDSILDQGYYTQDASGNLVINKDKNGEPLPTQQLLDGGGGLAADADGTPYYIDFEVEEEVAFATLIAPFATPEP